MGVKVRPFYKGAVVDISAPKPVDVNATVSVNKQSSTQVHKTVYAPEFENTDIELQGEERENVYAPEEKIEQKGTIEEEYNYSPRLNVYVSGIFTDYAKAYLQTLLKLIEENNGED